MDVTHYLRCWSQAGSLHHNPGIGCISSELHSDDSPYGLVLQLFPSFNRRHYITDPQPPSRINLHYLTVRENNEESYSSFAGDKGTRPGVYKEGICFGAAHCDLGRLIMERWAV